MSVRARAVAVALAAAVGACGSDKGTGPAPSGLAGVWRASKAEYVSAANSSTKVDVVALGGTLVLTLTSAGTFNVASTSPGEPAISWAGTYSASVDMISFNVTSGFAGTMEFDMTLNGNTLTLTGADSEFDFNGDDAPEEAKLNLVLARQ